MLIFKFSFAPSNIQYPHLSFSFMASESFSNNNAPIPYIRLHKTECDFYTPFKHCSESASHYFIFLCPVPSTTYHHPLKPFLMQNSKTDIKSIYETSSYLIANHLFLSLSFSMSSFPQELPVPMAQH